jgi:alpha,alpha-trehalose phosphorylase
MGALWQALVMGFGGIRPSGDALAVDPRLPPGWDRLEVPFRFRGRRVSIVMEAARVVVRSSPGLRLLLRGSGPIVLQRRTSELRPTDDGWALTGRRSG